MKYWFGIWFSGSLFLLCVFICLASVFIFGKDVIACPAALAGLTPPRHRHSPRRPRRPHRLTPPPRGRQRCRGRATSEGRRASNCVPCSRVSVTNCEPLHQLGRRGIAAGGNETLTETRLGTPVVSQPHCGPPRRPQCDYLRGGGGWVGLMVAWYGQCLAVHLYDVVNSARSSYSAASRTAVHWSGTMISYVKKERGALG